MRVVFFGDSICVGQYVSPHRTWATAVSAHIGRELGGEVVVINSSVNGGTTRLALERIPADVQNYEPDAVLVQFGLNDCNHWHTDRGVPRVSPRAFEANLHEIADRARHFGARLVVFDTNHRTLRDSDYEQRNRAYNEITRRVARERGDVLVDVEAEFGDGDALRTGLLPDAIHLSEEGHVRYTGIVGPPLLDALRQL